MEWNYFVKTAGPRPSERKAAGLSPSPSSVESVQDANPIGSLSSQKAWMRDRGRATLAGQHPEDRKRFWNDYVKLQYGAGIGRGAVAAGAAAALNPAAVGAGIRAIQAVKSHPLVSASMAAHIPGLYDYVNKDPKRVFSQNPLKTLGELGEVSSRTMRDVGDTSARMIGLEGDIPGRIVDGASDFVPVLGTARAVANISGDVYKNNIAGILKSVLLNGYTAKKTVPLLFHAGYSAVRGSKNIAKRLLERYSMLP